MYQRTISSTRHSFRRSSGRRANLARRNQTFSTCSCVAARSFTFKRGIVAVKFITVFRDAVLGKMPQGKLTGARAKRDNDTDVERTLRSLVKRDIIYRRAQDHNIFPFESLSTEYHKSVYRDSR